MRGKKKAPSDPTRNLIDAETACGPVHFESRRGRGFWTIIVEIKAKKKKKTDAKSSLRCRYKRPATDAAPIVCIDTVPHSSRSFVNDTVYYIVLQHVQVIYFIRLW